MSTKEKTLSLRWLVLLIVVIAASLILWICYKASRIDPRTRQYTTQQWLQMVRQTQHQPRVRWEGIGCGTMDRNSAGMSGCTLGFERSSADVLEHQIDDLLKQDPVIFLPLFDSQHPQEILTGVYLYRNRYSGRDLKCTTEQKRQIEQAFRKLIDYRNDSRVRVAAIEYLGFRRLLTVEDVKKGLDDRSLDVRFTTLQRMDSVYEGKGVYTEDGKLLEGDPNQVQSTVQARRELAPILLDHINDPHFYVRSCCSDAFRDFFKRPVRTDSGGTTHKPVPGGPDRFDWMRESWQGRENKKAEWEKWWAEHGEEALRWAHPPQ